MEGVEGKKEKPREREREREREKSSSQHIAGNEEELKARAMD
ncbi:unnamed protein product [Camellia sinensis]